MSIRFRPVMVWLAGVLTGGCSGVAGVRSSPSAQDLTCLWAEQAPSLDGRHQGVWLDAPRISSFYRIERTALPQLADRNIDLRLMATRECLYISASVFDRDLITPQQTEQIADGSLRTGGDVLEVFLWPRHVVPLAYVEIHVYPDGGTWQAIHLDRKGNPHPWPAPLAFASTTMAERGGTNWVVQIAIPWSAVTRPDAHASKVPQEYGVLVSRVDVDRIDGPDKPQTQHYASAPLSTLWFHMIEQYGILRVVKSANGAGWLDRAPP